MSKQINNLNKSLHQDYAKDSTVTTKVNEVKTEMGSLGNLKTAEKGNLVGAINELFQDVDSGKQLIANAIDDESITKDSTFSAMSEAITKVKPSGKRSLYNELIDKGYEATESMSVEEMIVLLEDCDIDPNEIKQIACGGEQTFILKNDGSLWACGYNGNGPLGLGSVSDPVTTFTQVTININNDVKQIACGNSHTVILKNDGSIWSCGYNYYGQLGLSDSSNRAAFTQITTNINNDVKQIACGYNCTVILKTDGTVWTCGYNGYGQLGLGNNTSQKIFTKVTTNVSNDVKQIACGVDHTVILKNDGSVWACGYNYDGELGLGNTTSQTIFTQVTTNINNDVKQIACGGYFTFIIKNDGSVWTCGYNNYGQLGLGAMDDNAHKTFTQVTTNINNDVKQIACGRSFTFIIKNDGSVWCCGYNNRGQLGLGDTTARTSFTQVTTNVKQAACGSQYTVMLKNDGSLWACGNNVSGQLGLGDSHNRPTFTNAISIDTSLEYLSKLKLYQFLKRAMNLPVNGSMSIEEMLEILVNKGDHLEDVLNNVRDTLISLMQEGGHDINDDESINSLLNSLILSGINIGDIKQIACGSYTTFILKNDGSIWCCGYNNRGQLGLGDNTSQKIFTKVTTNINNDVKQVACGVYHTVILKDDGSVWASGYNYYGQLGLGDTTARTTFTQVTTNINNVKQIACGNQYTFILKNDGSLWTCGYNASGQLGLNDTIQRTSFTQVTTNINNDVKEVFCGATHTFILKNDGSTWSCGENSNGQLGLGDTTNRSTFAQALQTSTTRAGVEKPDENTGLNDVKQIACGNQHTVILKNDGSVWVSGYNAYGSLGLGTSDTNKTTFVQVINNAKQIVCGGYHTIVLKSDGSLWATGDNDYGQLGLNNTTQRTSFTQIIININNDIRQIDCGYGHTFILKKDGSVWCCGDNNYGQLGFGDNTQRNTFTQVPRGF